MAAACCPKTFTGFCLANNTPIAITLDNGVLISWTNLVTGVVTAGNPPAGTGVCEVPSTVTIEVEPLTCEKDSVTVCPPDDAAPFHVIIDSSPGGAATEVTLAAILIELGQKYEGGAIALDGPTLAALENINVTVSNPTTGLATEVTLAAVLTELGQKLEPGGEVALNAATLAALETITVLQGTSPWVVSGAITVSNFPASQVVTATDLDTRNLDCLTDSVTVCVVDPLPIDDPQANKRFQPGVRTTLAIPISALGNNTIVTPAAGMRLRVTWLGMSSSEVGLETLAIVKFGAAGTDKYRWHMGAPGAFSHWEAIEGAVDEPLIVNLSLGTIVQVNWTYEEF